jgi:tetratricopeptide (TPR) repeat protein
MTEQKPIPDSYDYWYQKGSKQLDTGKYAESIISFDKALQYKVDDHDAFYKKGNAHFYLQQYEIAEGCYGLALVSKPDSQNAWESRGLVLNQLQRYEKAIASFHRALEIQPDLFRARWGRGNALMELGRTEESVSDYDKALELQPDSHAVWALHGKACEKLKRYSEALTSYERVLELAQAKEERLTEAETLRAMIFMYVFNGRSQDAFDAFNKSTSIIRELNLPPNDPLQTSSLMGSVPLFPEQIPYQPLMNLWGRLVGFGFRGKPQLILVFVIWFLLLIPSLILIVPWGIARWISQRFARQR